MNTQGWVRGLIAFNRPLDKFIDFITNTLTKEFEFQIELREQGDSYKFCFDNYEVTVQVQELMFLQKKGPYALDKFLLESLKTQGFKFDLNRSQYVEYCYR